MSKLKHPDEFGKQWRIIKSLQWTNRAASAVGGSLLLVGTSNPENPHSLQYTQTGGVIAIMAPFVEAIASYINDKVYEVEDKKWKEFLEDTKNLLDNYHELLGILEKVEKRELGAVNITLNNLRDKVEDLLERYGEKKDKVIDILKLINNKEKLAEDLGKKNKWVMGGKLGRIVQVSRQLEENIIRYRSKQDHQKISLEEKLEEKKQKLAWIIFDWLEECSDSLDFNNEEDNKKDKIKKFDAEKEYNNKGKNSNKWKDENIPKEYNTWKEYLENEGEFNKCVENLLHPLIEVIIDKLKKTNTEESKLDKIIKAMRKLEEKIKDYEKDEACKLEEVAKAISKLDETVGECRKAIQQHHESTEHIEILPK